MKNGDGSIFRSNLSAIVLAGGESTRIEIDKALLMWNGEYLIVRLVRLLKSYFDEVLVITGRTRRYGEILDVPILEDAIKDKGPMGGIYTGLLASSNDDNLITACDMPLLDLRVISLLLNNRDGSQAVVPEIGGYLEPLLGIYSKSCIPKIEELLERGCLKVQDLLNLVAIKTIPEDEIMKVDPDLNCFTNLNTRDDLKIWQGYLPDAGRRNNEPKRGLKHMSLLWSGLQLLSSD